MTPRSRPPRFLRHSRRLSQIESRATRLKVPIEVLQALEVQARRYYQRHYNQRAAIVAERVLSFDKTRFRAWLLLGDLAARNGEWRAALINFDRARQVGLDSAVVWCRGAEALFKIGEIRRAHAWFEQAIRLESAQPAAATARAQAYLKYYHAVFARALRRPHVPRADSPQTRELDEADFEGRRPARRPRR